VDRADVPHDVLDPAAAELRNTLFRWTDLLVRQLLPAAAVRPPSTLGEIDAGDWAAGAPRKKRHMDRHVKIVRITALDAHHSQIAWIENSSR
jgi:hypothetical protein